MIFEFSDLERPTYNCPCEKQLERKSIPTDLNVCPCDLLFIIALESLTGNCVRLYRNGKSVGIIQIRGTRAIFSIAGPVIITASIILLRSILFAI